jgi:hypothetical protein
MSQTVFSRCNNTVCNGESIVCGLRELHLTDLERLR